MKKVFICSPYAGEVERNVGVAEILCRLAVDDGVIPFAPHLLYTRFMDDDDPEDRMKGIGCGLAFMAVCDEVWAYDGNGISSGMKREIAHAGKIGKRVILWDPFPAMLQEQGV